VHVELDNGFHAYQLSGMSSSRSLSAHRRVCPATVGKAPKSDGSTAVRAPKACSAVPYSLLQQATTQTFSSVADEGVVLGVKFVRLFSF
jgi:hypothetical protein